MEAASTNGSGNGDAGGAAASGAAQPHDAAYKKWDAFDAEAAARAVDEAGEAGGGSGSGKRPREEGGGGGDKEKEQKKVKKKEEKYDRFKSTERRKLIVKGPHGWDVELKPMLTKPTPMMGPNLLPLPIKDMLLESCKHERCSLDEYHNYKLHCEPNVGVYIDLIKGDTPPGDPTNVLPEEDEKLLKSLEPLMGPEVGAGSGDAFAKGKNQAKSAVWLKNTVYLSNNLHAPVHDFGSRSKEQEELARATLRQEIVPAAARGKAAVEASFAAAAAVDAATLKHDKKPHLTARCCVPIAPDLKLWANPYVQVSVGDDPDFAVRGKVDAAGAPLALGTKALVSKVCTTQHKRRGQRVLSASYSTPADGAAAGGGLADEATFDWKRQYQLNFKEEAAALGDRLVLFVDRAGGVATYLQQKPKRMELDKGRPVDAAREDADIPIDLKWSGKTVVKYAKDHAHAAIGFDAASRNAYRAEMRAIDNVDVSEDEPDEDSDDEDAEDEDA